MKKSIVKRMTAAALTALMLPTLPLSAHAEEEVVKNFEYFQSLSDYEVYVEYYKTYTELGFKFGEMLDRVPTAWYETPHHYLHIFMTPDNGYNTTEITYLIQCTPECLLDMQDWLIENAENRDGDWLKDSPEFLGFPEEWTGVFDVYNFMGEWYDPITHSHFEYLDIQIDMVPQLLSKIIPDYEEYMYQQDIFDAYRITLTLQNSEFWKTYGAEGECIVPPFRVGDASETPPFFGDSNRDGAIDAQDASVVLINAALCGCGSGDRTPEEIYEQTGCDVTVSDLNSDGYFDAADAALLLEYTAAVGTGSKASLREYIEQNAETNE